MKHQKQINKIFTATFLILILLFYNISVFAVQNIYSNNITSTNNEIENNIFQNSADLSNTTKNNRTQNTLELSSDAIILIDNKTNKILYSKNENKKMYPASTTKILTAILTLENCNLTDVITASYDSIMSIPDGYSTANIQVGEELTVEQLLKLLLVHSSNDAANILAEHIGGSIESFISMMNTKINELGLTDSHFTNAYGKHDDNHYTTAHDLSIIMQYCLKNEDFRKLAGLASCAIPATNKYSTRLYTSTNELIIPENKNYYHYITAGKTGYTSQAKECLVASAYKDDLELISVILGCDSNNSNRFSETRKLFEYGFSNYSIRKVVSKYDIGTQIEIKNGTKDTKNLDLLIENDISALLNNNESTENYLPQIDLNENISAPIEQGSVIGKITYIIDDIEYSSNLIASHNVEQSKLLSYILYISFGIILLIFWYEIFFSDKRKKKEKY